MPDMGSTSTFTDTVTLGDAVNISIGTGTGTKIGTSTSQKIAFYNAAPVIQRTGIANTATDTVDGTYGVQEQTVIGSLRTKLDQVLQVLEDMGITAVA